MTPGLRVSRHAVWVRGVLALGGAVAFGNAHPRASAPLKVYLATLNPVSPVGRWILLTEDRGEGERDRLAAVLDWKTGRIVARVTTSLISVLRWGRGGVSFLAWEGIPGSRDYALVARRVPDLSLLARVPVSAGTRAPAGGCLSRGGGAELVIALPSAPERSDIAVLGLEQERRLLALTTDWLPQAVMRTEDADVIVCSTSHADARPLALLHWNGSFEMGAGPALPAGRYVVVGYTQTRPAAPFSERLDRVAWQAPGDGRCVLAVRDKEGWQQRVLQIPPVPESATSRLVLAGNDRLVLLQFKGYYDIAAWSVSWDGRLERLRFPRATEAAAWVAAWPGGRHLVRVQHSNVELIDGQSGSVVRTVPVRL